MPVLELPDNFHAHSQLQLQMRQFLSLWQIPLHHPGLYNGFHGHSFHLHFHQPDQAPLLQLLHIVLPALLLFLYLQYFLQMEEWMHLTNRSKSKFQRFLYRFKCKTMIQMNCNIYFRFFCSLDHHWSH